MQTLEVFHLFAVHVDYKHKCYAHSGVNHKRKEIKKGVACIYYICYWISVQMFNGK